jgi:cell division protein FtsB
MLPPAGAAAARAVDAESSPAMPTETRRLVIRPHRPWQRPLLWTVLAVVVLGAVYLAFEAGRHGAGHDTILAWQQRRGLQTKMNTLEKTNAALRAEIAELKTGQVSSGQEREALARNVVDLQRQLARQNQDLAFYRGIISSPAGESRVNVHRAVIEPADTPGRFRVSVVLVQTARPEKDVSGTVALSVEGSEQGRPVVYPLERLSGGKTEPLKFSFRYFEDLVREMTLPPGFTPANLNVEVRVSGRGGPVSRKFEWRTQEQ